MADADMPEGIENALVGNDPIGDRKIAAQVCKRIRHETFPHITAASMHRLRRAAKPNESGYSSRPYANVRARSQQVKLVPATIAILDDDHVIRLTRYALSGPSEITTDWAREFFMPEEMDPAQVHALGGGLHEGDGVSLIPMSAKLDLRK